MVDKCQPDYPRMDIIKNCHTTNKSELLNDFLLSLPATTWKNTTYKNLFCAVCNHEVSFLIWNVAVDCKLEQGENSSVIVNDGDNVDSISILSNLRVDRNRSMFVSKVNESIFKCTVHGFVPSSWTETVQMCDREMENRTSSVSERSTFVDEKCPRSATSPGYRLFVDLRNPYLPKGDHDLYRSLIFDNFMEEYLGDCPAQCWINRALEVNKDFRYINNETIHLKEYDMQYGRDEWTYTLAKDIIYVCGSVKPRPKFERLLIALNKLIVSILTPFSMFSLALMAILYANKEKLQSLPNKVILSSSITLLAVYVVSRVMYCSKIMSIILHYLYLSYYTWLLVAAYDYWYVIYYSSNSYQIAAGKAHLKRYLVYCFAGWISPSFAMAAVMYLEFAPSSEIYARQLKLGYREKGLCLLNQRKVSYKFFSYPCTVICSTVIVLFIFTSYYIYSIKRKNLCSTAQNVYYKLFVKLALTLGLTWTQCFFYMYARILIVNTIFVTMTSVHGVLIFFAYGFEMSMIGKMCERAEEMLLYCKSKILQPCGLAPGAKYTITRQTSSLPSETLTKVT